MNNKIYIWLLFYFSTLLCSGCNGRKTDHNEISDDPDKQWNYKECTSISPTDAYGLLNFPGSHSKTAKVFLWF